MKLRCCLIYDRSTGRTVPAEGGEERLRSCVTAVVHSYIRGNPFAGIALDSVRLPSSSGTVKELPREAGNLDRARGQPDPSVCPEGRDA